MGWTQTLGTLAGMVVGLFTIWWRLDRKIDDLNAFLRDTLLEFKGEIGELRGAVRNHTPSQD